jgi:hypothetical protein
METSPSFVALWVDKQGDGSPRLNILTQESAVAGKLPNTQPPVSALELLLPQLPELIGAPTERQLLLLDASLPPDWLALDWEGMTFRGRPLPLSFLVVRRPKWGSKQQTGIHRTKFLNLFPRTEHDFPAAMRDFVTRGSIRPCSLAFLAQELQQVSELVVFAHGDGRGLMDAERNLLSFPEVRPMPDRIWLLACNVTGAMNRLAEELLDQGVRTVISADGYLSAPEMEALVHSWLSSGDESADPAAWLGRRDDSARSADGGVHSLRIWGEIDLDRSASAPWNRLAWDLRHGEPGQLPLHDLTEEAEFLEAYTGVTAAPAWPTTRQTLAAPLLWLAEKFHHPSIESLERLLGSTDSPDAIHALAASARRVGNYRATARYLSRGLELPGLHAAQRADYLGGLANLLIDLDLPASSFEVIRLHEDCDIDDTVAKSSTDLKRLDFLGRTEARRGNFEVALMHLAAKRYRAVPEEGRELAALLYVGTWAHIAQKVDASAIEGLANEAMAYLDPLDYESVGRGNDTNKYLLRAVAAFGWATRQKDALELTTRWRVTAIDRLVEHDPGPWAYLLAFLKLAGLATPADFHRAHAALERAGYLLEAAMFIGLDGRPDEGRRLLQRFDLRRTDVLAALELNDRSKLLPPSTFHAEALERQQLESSVFGDALAVARSGVMPL